MTCAVARADQLGDLEAQGEDLAKRSEYTRAIEAFKQADRIAPRANHACMIGLAYLRRELWSQAEVWLSICEQRVNASDPAPSWIDEAEHQLGSKLSDAQIPAITFVVTPPGANARIALSTFASDESFPPRTVHLAAGTYVVEVRAPGYHALTREITIRAGEPVTVTLALEPDAAAKPSPLPIAAPAPHATRAVVLACS